MEILEQFWAIFATTPRYIGHAGIVLNMFGVIMLALSALQSGPLGGRFSGKQASDGSGRQGPLPGHEPDSVIRKRKFYFGIGILFLLVGTGLIIAAAELEVSSP